MHHIWLRSVQIYHVSGGPTHGHGVVNSSDADSAVITPAKRISTQPEDTYCKLLNTVGMCLITESPPLFELSC